VTDRTTSVHKRPSFQEHDDGFGDESIGKESDSLFSYTNFSPKRSIYLYFFYPFEIISNFSKLII
jgi:hypothetical protein